MKVAIIRLRALLSWHPGWVVFISALVLTWIGIQVINTADAALATKQKFWMVPSLVAFAACLLPIPRQVGRAAYCIYGAMLILLLCMVMPGIPQSIVPVNNGARSWINLQIMNVQPSEFMKIAVVLVLAWHLRYRDSYRSVSGLLVPFAIVFVPVMLILMQPDLGTGILFGPTLFVMLMVAGARLHHLVVVLLLAAIAIAINIAIIFMLPESVQILKSHQRTRIKAMASRARDDPRYDHSTNYQQVKAIMLVGSGQVRGFGGSRSRTIVAANRLPHDHNDMIFAVLVNRWGFFGGSAVLGLFGVMTISMCVIASRAKDPFARLATVGFATILFVQASMNMAIAMGLLPVTGITLPFISYGGSSLLTTFIIVGLVINFISQHPLGLAWPSFEHEQSDLPATM